MSVPENIKLTDGVPSTHVIKNAIISIWFPHEIEKFDHVYERKRLTPQAALCLLIMVTEGVSCSRNIEMHLANYGGGSFGRTESKVVSEVGLYDLRDIGYLRLDAKGKKELDEHDGGYYGLGEVQWLLTAKGARAMAPIYCSCKGLPSHEQEGAVKDMLAANKAAVSSNRKKLKAAA